ncbi:MAG: glutathione S-transferase N-terminal domain-containing protein [Sphingomonadaceae bacterium]
MIELFGGQTPNVFKPLIMLEEIGAEYRRVPLDISRGEQFTPEFLAISPNNRVPAIVDHAPADGGAPLSVFESGAILVYLAEKSGKFLPVTPRERVPVLEWVMWQMGGQGPMSGQAGHFRNYAPEKIPYGIERYTNEVRRLYGVLDKRLKDREFIAGDYSIADMACWPWIVFRDHHGIDLAEFPEVERWFAAIRQRPAVQRTLGDYVAPAPQSFTDEELAILFGIKK